MSRDQKTANNIDRTDTVVLLLAAAAIIVFFPVRGFDFVAFDDAIHITGNQYVRDGLTIDGIRWAFTTTREGNWVPIMWLSHMVDAAIYGVSPGGHHISNLIFHIVNVILLFLLFKEMTGELWQSAFVAALFAIHPAHVETVAWVSQRKELLSALFCFLAMLKYVQYARKPSIKHYLYVIIFFVLALMSKPMAVTLPFVLLLIDVWPLGRLRETVPAKLVMEKIPMFAISGIFSVITYYAQKNYNAVVSVAEMPLSLRLSSVLAAYVKYLKNALFPTGLSVFYPRMDVIAVWQWAGAFVLLAAVSAYVIFSIKRKPYLFTGWFWFLGTLVPVIGIVQVGAQGMADRYTYIPFIGLFAAAAFAVPLRYAARLPVRIMAIVIICASALLSMNQVRYWKNSAVLLSHAAETVKTSALSYYNLGTALAGDGKYREALDAFDKAIAIDPTRADVYVNKGVVYIRIHEYEKAVDSFEKAVKIKPGIPEAYNGLGEAMLSLGRGGEAAEMFQKAISISQNSSNAGSDLNPSPP
ncbi:MAG: tetratricopeptide repeat protein [Candidatus Magnetominusculus sp. LBB02]|nr:tetratricopeptide repeat protein [Candidatus Magnetominusculus sp. LBB02]